MTASASTDTTVSVTRTLRAVAAYGLPSRLAPAELGEPAWSQFLEAAKQERLQGLVGEAIEAGVLPASAEQADQARRARTEANLRVLALEGMLLRALAVLGPAQPVRLLKGPVLARTVYSRPSSRLFIDIDLLLPSAHVDAVDQEAGGRWMGALDAAAASRL